jgi:histidine ammonia-lyase
MKPNMPSITLDGNSLTIEQIEEFLRGGVKVSLAPAARTKVAQGNKCIRAILKREQPIYGVNTGFGKLSSITIRPERIERLQVNLIRSHCSGVGPPMGIDEVRLAMLLRANALAKGYSGVRPLVIETLLKMLNAGITPVVPQQGSCGASGDLAPLAHMVLGMMGEGQVFYGGQLIPAEKALKKTRISPIVLQAKEGLALINGTQAMTAIGIINLIRARDLIKNADIAAAMSLEALRGTPAAFDEGIHALRPYPGQITTAANFRRLLQGSEIVESHRDCPKIQDAYSLRCVPQVHGPIRDTFHHVASVLLTEVNSVSDNPIVFPERNLVLSGGNFHGESIALAMDFLAIAMSELANISERRIEHMVDPDVSGMPAFLTEGSGLNSGLMMAQVTAASLVSENKSLAHPASVDSIPTSANREDHVSMGTIAARKCRQIIDNVERVLAIEFLAAAQGLEFARPLRASEALEEAHAVIRKKIPKITEDRVFSNDIFELTKMIRSRVIIKAVESVAGPLAL